MYNRPEEFGGSLFALAVSVLTDLIHHEPQSFRQLNEAGLPDAFLAAIKVRSGALHRAGLQLQHVITAFSTCLLRLASATYAS
jgi:hypothetical protein